MSSIFTKIVSGEVPCYKVMEDDQFLAFLDVFPLAKGHTLVIPKVEIDYIFDMEDDQLASMHIFTKKVAKLLKSAIPCKKIGVSVVGLEVPHAHIHLIPIQNVSDMNFSAPKLTLTKEEMLQILTDIKQHILV